MQCAREPLCMVFFFIAVLLCGSSCSFGVLYCVASLLHRPRCLFNGVVFNDRFFFLFALRVLQSSFGRPLCFPRRRPFVPLSSSFRPLVVIVSLSLSLSSSSRARSRFVILVGMGQWRRCRNGGLFPLCAPLRTRAPPTLTYENEVARHRRRRRRRRQHRAHHRRPHALHDVQSDT